MKQITEFIANDEFHYIDDLIHSLEIDEQLSIHSILDRETLKYLTENIDKLKINDSVKEHILWSFYSEMEWTDELLVTLIEVYSVDRYIAVESIIVNAIKSDVIQNSQIDKIIKSFENKEIPKQLYLRTIRMKLKDEQILSQTELKTLLDFRGYELIEKALDKELITGKGIELIENPKPGEKDRKWKERLYRKSKSNIKQEF
ncbi:hypothetical protein [Paenibacillus sp. HB172176]|uniref:hypothetical protein n=1 Tax=Paenibacillus sp. HB172176 TaxID=2493690 RepID=UPI0014389456|nr:hypothetical protein [Paenibacillus sp. HB172176]